MTKSVQTGSPSQGRGAPGSLPYRARLCVEQATFGGPVRSGRSRSTAPACRSAFLPNRGACASGGMQASRESPSSLLLRTTTNACVQRLPGRVLCARCGTGDPRRSQAPGPSTPSKRRGVRRSLVSRRDAIRGRCDATQAVFRAQTDRIIQHLGETDVWERAFAVPNAGQALYLAFAESEHDRSLRTRNDSVLGGSPAMCASSISSSVRSGSPRRRR
jgi:hypothetical protein